MAVDLYSAPCKKLTSDAFKHGSHSFTLQTHHTCLHLVSFHQRAPPLGSGSSHLVTAYYSFIDPERMKG